LEHRLLLLAGAILLGYAWSLRALLRRESSTARLVLLLLCICAFALRVVAFSAFPPGMNEDEPKVLACSLDALKKKVVHTEGCSGLPFLLTVLFQAQLVPWLGPNRPSMRFYSILTGTLSVAAAYGAARALQMRALAALSFAALVATLPWSLFYGRIAFGAQLTLHELLLLAGVARIVFRAGGAGAVLMAWFGQTLLLYDYFAGRLFLPFSLVAVVLGRGWRRLLGLVVPLLAFAAWLPYYLSPAQHRWVPGGRWPALSLANLLDGLRQVLRVFVWPLAADGWITVRSAAVHPWPILGLAILGCLLMLSRPRLALLTFAGFVLGIAPAVATFPSAHRMMMAYPFISLAAAYALERLPRGEWRRIAAVVFVGSAALASVRFYFSEDFWPPQSRSVSGEGVTQLVESVPYPLRGTAVVAPGLGYFFAVRERTDRGRVAPLDVRNWWPDGQNESWYLFTAHWQPLEAFYRSILGERRVRSFGGPFSVYVERGDWSWLREYGWRYEAQCAQPEWQESGQVPVLFHIGQTFPGRWCSGRLVHRWTAQWMGDRSSLRLKWEHGEALVALSRGTVLASERKQIDFEVQRGEVISISLVLPKPTAAIVFLFRRLPSGEMAPEWTAVRPHEWAEPVACTLAPD